MQTILMVDDDRFALGLLAEGLENYYLDQKAKVLKAASCQEAIELIKKNTVSVLITDMYLEDPDAGFILIRFTKRHKPSVLIIVVTAFATLSLIPHWMRAGAFEVIPKPFGFEDIWPSIRRGLELADTRLDRDALIERLILEEWEVVKTSKLANEKGASLEDLCSMLFGTIPGWSQIESRLSTDAEEFDLVIANESTDRFWEKYGTVILVECKNWHQKRKPGRSEFDSFFSKLRRRSPSDCRLGFM